MDKFKRFAILSLILLVGLFLRLWVSHYKLAFIDYDPFYHARIAEYIYEHGALPRWDPRELGGIPYYYPPSFHIVMALSKYVFQQLNFLEIGSYLNIFFGILSIPLLYLLTKDEFDIQVAMLAAILLAVSPALVFRTTLWARPNGLNIFLPILTVFVFSKLRRDLDIKWYITAVFVSILYVFSHSFVILTLAIVWIAILSEGNRKSIFATTSIIFITSIIGYLYYYRFVPFLNLSFSPDSWGYTVEYQPLISISLRNLTIAKMLSFDFYYWGSYLSFYHLSVGLLLIIFGGLPLMYKRGHNFFLILTLFSLLSVFFKVNVTMAFLFMFCIAIAIAISDISYRTRKMRDGGEVMWGWSLAITLILIFVLGSVFLTSKMRSAEFIWNTDIVREVLIDVPLHSNNTIIANDPDLGHEIVYYSDANTFNSDLTDVKAWGKHMKVYEMLRDTDFTVPQAVDIMKENGIDHLLLVYDNQTQIFPFARGAITPYFTLVNERSIGNRTARLYRVTQ
ncbi:MAG: glycosyltransferase family 39 protein [Candidatus Hydrothermarchaeales archaeon]